MPSCGVASRTGSVRPYHHGDLAEALVSEGLALAQDGGPEAVTLREVARRIGVSPTAAYRHYEDRDALLGAVGRRARERLAQTLLDASSTVRRRDHRRRARERLRAMGAAYVRFGFDQPGLLAVAFLPLPSPPGAEGPELFAVLAGGLADLVAVGDLRAERLGDAALLCWSAVHGLATLAAAGGLAASPLSAWPAGASVDAAIASLVATVEQSLASLR